MMFLASGLMELGRQKGREAFRESFWFVLLVFFVSLVVYCVPVLIYRFGIRHGQPLESKWKATWVGWIFWICSFTAICLYYLAFGYYDEDGFSVRAGLPDMLCMAANWFLLYFPFKHKAKQKCSKCGASLSPNAKFCTECGEKFVPKPVTDTVTCPCCQKTIKPTNFCPECGHKFADEQQNPPQPTKPLAGSSPKAYSRVYVNSLGDINRESEPRPRKEDSAEEDVAKIAFICIGFVVVLIAIVVAVCMAFLN